MAGQAHGIRLLEHESVLYLPSTGLRAGLPVAVALGADGTICVTDATSGAGYLFDRDVLVYGTGAIAGLTSPMDLVVDASGGFACTDGRLEGGRTIRRLDFFGLPLAYEAEQPLNFWQPEHLLLTRDGHYLTTDPSNGLLVKHDATTGSLLWKIDLAELREGEVIAIGKPAEAPDGRIFLPVPGDHQVMVLSADGRLLDTFGVAGGGRGRLAFPIGVAICPDGSIAVLDKMRHTILLYDGQYRFESESGQFGSGREDLYYPDAIAAAADGRIYVIQGFEGRIHRFRFTATGAVNVIASRPWLMGAGRVERFDRSRGEGV
jgi:hypothetical protein